jgi:hypothetical protein
MPDDQDYADFWAMLDRAEGWTEDDAATAHWHLRQQRELVTATHPKDHAGRKRLAEVVEDIETTIRRYEAAR